MFVLDGAVPGSSTGQQYSVRILPDENTNLPGVISYTDAIPGFIHYYNPSDAVFKERLFVEVGGGFCIRQSQRGLNPIQG